MKKSTKIILTVLGSMLIVGFFTCLITLAIIDFDYTKLSTVPPEVQPIQVDEQLSIWDGTSISIDISFSDVYIGVSNDEMMHITYHETDQRTYEIAQDNDEIKLSSVNSGRYESHRQKTWWDSFFYVNFSNNWEKNNVTVLIPSHFTGALSIDGGSGNKTLENIFVNSIYIKSGSGSISANKISSKTDISFYAGSGSININEVNSSTGVLIVDGRSGHKTLENIFANTIEVESSSGQIGFSELDAKNIIIDSSSGSVRGSIVGSKNDFSVISSTGSGRNNLPTEWGQGSKMLDVSTSSGDIDVSFTE